MFLYLNIHSLLYITYRFFYKTIKYLIINRIKYIIENKLLLLEWSTITFRMVLKDIIITFRMVTITFVFISNSLYFYIH